MIVIPLSIALYFIQYALDEKFVIRRECDSVNKECIFIINMVPKNEYNCFDQKVFDAGMLSKNNKTVS